MVKTHELICLDVTEVGTQNSIFAASRVSKMPVECPMNYEITYHEILTIAVDFGIQVIPWSDCKCGEQKGAGASMNVFAGTCKMNEKEYNVAFKRLIVKLTNKTKPPKRSQVLMDIRQELRIMGALKGCPQIIQLLGISFNEHDPILVLELAENDLEGYLIDDINYINWDIKLLFISDIAAAIETIHNAKVIHGDLKAENILICEANDRKLAKVSDFGFSSTDLSVEQGSGPGGTKEFQAPEYPDHLSSKIDIYSYGLLVWQIAMDGDRPFNDKMHDEIDDMKRDGTALKFLIEQLPKGTPEQIKKIIERTVIREPSERASIKDILEILNSREKREEAKDAFESWARYSTQGTVWVSKLEKLSIPVPLRKSIFTEYQESDKKGDMVATSRLGSCYRFGFGTEKNIDKAFECFKKAAEGYLPAQTELGFCYFNGEGVKKDPVKAFELFMSAATEANDPLAQFNVGFCYEDGRGVSHNQDKAIRFYEKAAEAGIFQAQYNLGLCYMYGKGVIENMKEALELFTKAAEAGYPPAQCYLGYCYANGLGIPQDYFKCTEFYRKAALSGDATAQYNLGNMYLRGIAVPQDLEEARKYFEMAAEQEDLEAKHRLDLLDHLKSTDPSYFLSYN